MREDYSAAAKAMYESAFRLHKEKQWHLSCYLAGYVVECALKSILQQHDRRAYLRGHLNDEDKETNPAELIDQLTQKFPHLLKTYPFLKKGTKFFPATIIEDKKKSDPTREILAWKSKYRYSPDIWNSEQASVKFQKEIASVRFYI